MGLKEYIARAKRILKEDAGSEGLCYCVKFKGTLKEEGFTVEEKSTEDGVQCAKIKFAYPRDYGFALQTLKDLGIEVVGLELLF